MRDGVRVYVLIEDWGEYNDYTRNIVGVFSTPEAAMASKPEVPWSEARTGVTHRRQHSGGCFQCQSDWSIEGFIVDGAPDPTPPGGS